MTETYTMVGHDASWIVALMPIPALIGFYLGKRGRGEPMPPLWRSLIPIAYFLVCSIAGLPMEWIFGGACVGAGIVFFFTGPKHASVAKYSPSLRWGLGLVYLVSFSALGYFWTTMASRFPDNLTLREDSVKFTWIGRTNTIPRGGLSLSVIGPHRLWFDLRSWGSWSSTSGHGQESQSGPYIAGSNIYWGPHGLIRGDDLALHFAHWAHVVPMVLVGNRYPYKEIPLSGFSLAEPHGGAQ